MGKASFSGAYSNVSAHYKRGPLGLIPAIVLPNKRLFVVNAAMLRMIGLPEEAVMVFKEVNGVLLVKKWVGSPINGGLLAP